MVTKVGHYVDKFYSNRSETISLDQRIVNWCDHLISIIWNISINKLTDSASFVLKAKFVLNSFLLKKKKIRWKAFH